MEQQWIFRAAREGDEREVAVRLKAYPALLEKKDKQMMTLLSAAAEDGQLGVVVLLLERHAKVSAPGRYNRTALHWAAVGGHEEVVSLLLSKGAKAESSDDFGMTPLISASGEGHLGVVRLLSQHMGDEALDTQDKDGMDALHYAAEWGHEEVAAFLLSKGTTSPEDLSHSGKTPFMLACKGGHMGVVRMFAEHMKEVGLDEGDLYGRTALHYAAEEGREPVVDYLLSKVPRGKCGDENDITPLMLAAKAGRVGVARILLQHGGKEGLEETDVNGWTALHHAVSKSRAEMVRFLLVSGADPTVEDHEGTTPRELADCGWRGEIVEVLEWWERDLECRAVLFRAMCIQKACAAHRDMPTSQVPVYLKARAAAGRALPRVEVVSPPPQEEKEPKDALGRWMAAKRKAESMSTEAQEEEREEEEERHAVLQYVMQALNQQLFTELLEGFHCEE